MKIKRNNLQTPRRRFMRVGGRWAMINGGREWNKESINGHRVDTRLPFCSANIWSKLTSKWKSTVSRGPGHCFEKICKDRTPVTMMRTCNHGLFFFFLFFFFSSIEYFWCAAQFFGPGRFELFPGHLKSCDHRLSPADHPVPDRSEWKIDERIEPNPRPRGIF